MDGALIDAAGASLVAVWQKITARQYADSQSVNSVTLGHQQVKTRKKRECAAIRPDGAKAPSGRMAARPDRETQSRQ